MYKSFIWQKSDKERKSIFGVGCCLWSYQIIVMCHSILKACCLGTYQILASLESWRMLLDFLNEGCVGPLVQYIIMMMYDMRFLYLTKMMTWYLRWCDGHDDDDDMMKWDVFLYNVVEVSYNRTLFSYDSHRRFVRYGTSRWRTLVALSH